MRVYTVEFENVAVAAAQDLFEISPGDDVPVRLLQLELHNVGPDVGDTEEEMLRLKVIRGNATSGSGGSAAAENPIDSTDAAATFASEVNNTTEASAGTEVDLWSGGWNVRVPFEKTWLLFPDADTRPRCDQGDGLIVVRLMEAPGDSVTMSGTLTVAEG